MDLIEFLRSKLSAEDLALLKAEVEGPAEGDYEAVIRRVAARLKKEEGQFSFARSRLELHLHDLIDHPEGRRLTILRNSSPALLLVLFHDLLGKSWNERWGDLKLSLRLAVSALEIAQAVADSGYLGSPDSKDLLAEAHSYLGNARRINSDARGAEDCFELAETCLAEGTGDRRVRADYLRLLAFLRVSQGKCQEGAQLFDQEIALRRLLGDEESLGFSLIQRGWVATLLEEDSPRIAQLFEAGMSRVNDPHLGVQTTHSLAEMYARQGFGLRAIDSLGAGRVPEYFANEQRYEIAHQWIRGIACRALGESGEAERTLRAVIEELAKLGATRKLAIATLDLACVYAAQGMLEEVMQLAEAAHSIFQAEGLEKRALSAVVVLQEAIEAERVTEGLAVAVANFLARFRYNKALRFEWKDE